MEVLYIKYFMSLTADTENLLETDNLKECNLINQANNITYIQYDITF